MFLLTSNLWNADNFACSLLVHVLSWRDLLYFNTVKVNGTVLVLLKALTIKKWKSALFQEQCSDTLEIQIHLWKVFISFLFFMTKFQIKPLRDWWVEYPMQLATPKTNWGYLMSIYKFCIQLHLFGSPSIMLSLPGTAIHIEYSISGWIIPSHFASHLSFLPQVCCLFEGCASWFENLINHFDASVSQSDILPPSPPHSPHWQTSSLGLPASSAVGDRHMDKQAGVG